VFESSEAVALHRVEDEFPHDADLIRPQSRLARVRKIQIGSKLHIDAKAETTGYVRAFRRAVDWQRRCRLR
jgi:hypothetical protein